MRRKYLSEIQLDQVIRLKQSGASWLKIEKITSIPRRSAKLAYEEWERTKSTDELKEARTDVARDEFRRHVSQIIGVAEFLVNSLSPPTWPTERRKAEEFFHQLWSSEDRTGYPSDERRTLRHNLMLLEALKNHSREKVRWQALEEWKQRWNQCVDILISLMQICEELMTNILKQMPELSRKIDKDGIEKVSRRALVEGVLAVVWNGIEDGKPNEAPQEIKMVKAAGEHTSVVFGDRAARASLTFRDRQTADEAAKACAWAANSLCRGETSPLIQEALGAVISMQKIRREMEDMFDPLILTPVILRTRCELCPV